MGCRQCLPLSVVQLKGKHCRKPHCRNGVVDTFKHKDVVLKYVIILQESYSSRAVYVASRLEIAFIGTPNIEQQQQNCHSKEVDDTSCMKKTDNFLL